MVTRLRSVAPLQCGIVLSIVYAIGGLILAIIWLPFMAMMASMPMAMYGRAGMPMAGLGLFALIVFPIVYGIGGFIAGVIGAFIYNLAARVTGGLEITLDNTTASVAGPTYAV